jgi:hypothetical protein
MTEKQIYRLAFYLVAIGLNIYNIYNGIVRELVFITILSVLFMGFFIYLIIRIFQEISKPKRIPCTYPMNEFYNFYDEVPIGSRVSTPEDCEACDETDCDLRHCLIQE